MSSCENVYFESYFKNEYIEQCMCILNMSWTFFRWSEITEQLEYIKKLHRNSGHDDFHVPQIGGVEIDLVKLYELVQGYGGLKGIVGKEKKWAKIADGMKIPKQVKGVDLNFCDVDEYEKDYSYT